MAELAIWHTETDKALAMQILNELTGLQIRAFLHQVDLSLPAEAIELSGKHLLTTQCRQIALIIGDGIASSPRTDVLSLGRLLQESGRFVIPVCLNSADIHFSEIRSLVRMRRPPIKGTDSVAISRVLHMIAVASRELWVAIDNGALSQSPEVHEAFITFNRIGTIKNELADRLLEPEQALPGLKHLLLWFVIAADRGMRSASLRDVITCISKYGFGHDVFECCLDICLSSNDQHDLNDFAMHAKGVRCDADIKWAHRLLVRQIRNDTYYQSFLYEHSALLERDCRDAVLAYLLYPDRGPDNFNLDSLLHIVSAWSTYRPAFERIAKWLEDGTLDHSSELSILYSRIFGLQTNDYYSAVAYASFHPDYRARSSELWDLTCQHIKAQWERGNADVVFRHAKMMHDATQDSCLTSKRDDLVRPFFRSLNGYDIR